MNILGKDESHRFCHISLYQGVPNKKQVTTLEMAASENPTLLKSEGKDPSLFCTAFKRNRFFMFTKRTAERYALVI